MSTATHITLKMVSQTKQTEYTPYFRLEMLNNDDTLWGRTTYIAYTWEYLPSGLNMPGHLGTL